MSDHARQRASEVGEHGRQIQVVTLAIPLLGYGSDLQHAAVGIDEPSIEEVVDNRVDSAGDVFAEDEWFPQPGIPGVLTQTRGRHDVTASLATTPPSRRTGITPSTLAPKGGPEQTRARPWFHRTAHDPAWH